MFCRKRRKILFVCAHSGPKLKRCLPVSFSKLAAEGGRVGKAAGVGNIRNGAFCFSEKTAGLPQPKEKEVLLDAFSGAGNEGFI